MNIFLAIFQPLVGIIQKLGGYLLAFWAGKKAAESEQLEAKTEKMEKAHEVELNVDRAGSGDLNKLRNKWTRD